LTLAPKRHQNSPTNDFKRHDLQKKLFKINNNASAYGGLRPPDPHHWGASGTPDPLTWYPPLLCITNNTPWNSLPDNVISAPSLSTFRQRLKTFLFPASLPDIIIDHLYSATFSGY